MSELEKKGNIFIEKAAETLGKASIPPERNQFILITDREAICCKAEEAIRNSQETLNDVTPLRELTPWLTVLSETVYNALKRGVNIRWITEKPQNADALPKTLQKFLKNPKFSLRFVSTLPKAKLAIFDKKEMLMGIYSECNFAESPALWSNNPAIVSIAEDYFESCWKNGKDIKRQKGLILEESKVG